MTLTINDIKKFHDNYNRLTLLDHVILLVIEADNISTKIDIRDGVFKKYKQVTYYELKTQVSKLLKLGLIEFNYYLNHYILTKDGINELEFVKDFIDYKKIEDEVYSSS